MSPFHKSTKRDYLARVNDPVYPKWKAAELAKKQILEKAANALLAQANTGQRGLLKMLTR